MVVPDAQPSPLRVRRPRRGLPAPGVVALAVLVPLVAWGVVALTVAVAHDRNGYPGQGQLDRRLPPAGSRLDTFAAARRPLGAPAGFGRWAELDGRWASDAGTAHPLSSGPTEAVVTTGRAELFVHVAVVHAPPGSGIVVGWAGPGDHVLVSANDSGTSWNVSRTSASGVTLLGGFVAPVDRVQLRVEVRRDRLVVDGGGGALTVRLATPLRGTGIGLVGTGPDARFDEVAYLPL